MDEKVAVPLVLFIVIVAGVFSVSGILFDNQKSNFAVVKESPKSPLGILSEGSDCKFPQSSSDLIEFLSERKNAPFTMDSCPLIAQDFCVVLNSGSCLRQCLNVVQSVDGVCGSAAQAQTRITGQVILSPEECKRLSLSYDISASRFLRDVGAGSQNVNVLNPCTGSSGQAVSKVYSVDSPLQAYAKNLFESGDVVGYVVDEANGQPALEYVLCKDSRALVKVEGRSRCDNL